MHCEIVMSGFGGQGIMYMGDLLAQAAVQEGLNATFFPTYGAAMRGGTANCIVIVSSLEIGSPLLRKPDAAILMNQPSLNRFEPMIRENGVAICNASMIDPATSTRNGNLHSVWIPATQISKEIAGNERSANIVAFGAFLKAQAIVNRDTIEAIFKKLPAQKKAMIEKNLAALHAGMEFSG
jgi:2-oxoglutarate ferredoxin oxidoreductase subunit gamma